jgi:hypothetical protein
LPWAAATCQQAGSARARAPWVAAHLAGGGAAVEPAVRDCDRTGPRAPSHRTGTRSGARPVRSARSALRGKKERGGQVREGEGEGRGVLLSVWLAGSLWLAAACLGRVVLSDVAGASARRSHFPPWPLSDGPGTSPRAIGPKACANERAGSRPKRVQTSAVVSHAALRSYWHRGGGQSDAITMCRVLPLGGADVVLGQIPPLCFCFGGARQDCAAREHKNQRCIARNWSDHVLPPWRANQSPEGSLRWTSVHG